MYNYTVLWKFSLQFYFFFFKSRLFYEICTKIHLNTNIYHVKQTTSNQNDDRTSDSTMINTHNVSID